MDHIEWDLLSPLTPEAFSEKLCMELGLSGEAIPLVAHAVHEELMKHKKDAIEWGVIGGERDIGEDTGTGGDRPRDKSGFGLVKDKTGLGLGWGRAPKDGRGPKTLKSVWRDWQEAEEFRTKFEELTAEEVERREIERERASRCVTRVPFKYSMKLISSSMQAAKARNVKIPVDKESATIAILLCCLTSSVLSLCVDLMTLQSCIKSMELVPMLISRTHGHLLPPPIVSYTIHPPCYSDYMIISSS